MSSDQRWRSTFSIFVLIFFLPHNLTFGLCFKPEALALMKFRERIERDPFGALMNWGELHHCSWSGVVCSHNGRVIILNLRDLSLQGTLAPELGNLTHLKSLILRNNSFSGIVPKEVAELQELEILDLYDNNFGLPFPFTRRLLQLSPPSENPDVDAPPLPLPLPSATPPSTTNKETIDLRFPDPFLPPPETNANPPPDPPPPAHSLATPPTQPPPSDSLTIPPTQPPPSDSLAIPPTQPPPTTKPKSGKIFIIIGVVVGVFIVMIALVAAFFLLRKQKIKTVTTTRSSDQLQEDVAITVGVPKLKLSELEAACEDFSNIIGSTSTDATIYKGTLSTGSEIAVLAVARGSLEEDWSEDRETQFQDKMQSLSQVEHKNFLNLIGYCHEDEPFNRMLVFEYAPNGSLFEQLHAQDEEPLGWLTRLRIAMGVAYCVEHMNNIEPKPFVHTNLNSSSIYLSTDFAAKVADFSSTSLEPQTNNNVFSFGKILYEIITGKIMDSISLVLETKPVVDPTLESFEEGSVLEKLWEVVLECLKESPEMKEVVVKMREITGITPEAALPSRSPAWWAELEIISTEAT